MEERMDPPEFAPQGTFDIRLVAKFLNKPDAEGIVTVRATGNISQPGVVRFLDIRLPYSDNITISEHLFSPGDCYELVPDTSRSNEPLPVLKFTELAPVEYSPPPPRTSLPLNNPEEDAKKTQENKDRDARAARRDLSAQQLIGALNNPEGANALSGLLAAADERSIASALAAGLPAPAQETAGDQMQEDLAPQGSYGMPGLNSQAPNVGLGSVTSQPNNLPPVVDLAQDLVMEDHVDEGVAIGDPDPLSGFFNKPSQVNVGASGSGSVQRTISAEELLKNLVYLAEDVKKIPILEEEIKKSRLETEKLQREVAKADELAGKNADLVRYLQATILALKERMAALSAQLRTQAAQTTAAAEHLHAQAAQVNAAAGQLYTQAADSKTAADDADAFLQNIESDDDDMQ